MRRQRLPEIEVCSLCGCVVAVDKHNDHYAFHTRVDSLATAWATGWSNADRDATHGRTFEASASADDV